MNRQLLPKQLIHWTRFMTLACLMSVLLPEGWAQTSPRPGRNNEALRLNELRPFIAAPHAQQPPYEWSAVYLRNAFAQSNATEQYVLDSSLCSVGIVNTNQFEPAFRIYYAYDSSLRLSEQVFFQKQPNDSYLRFSRKHFSYDADGRRTQYLYQLWDDTGASWVDDYEEMIQYNAKGQQVLFQQRETDMQGQWQNLQRETRSYDTADNLILVRTETWNNNAWEDQGRTEISYNDFGFYTQILDLGYNNGVWDTLTREVALYDSFGFTWEGYRLDRHTGNGFEGVLRESYDYDSYGFFVGMTRQLRDSISSMWENTLQEAYTYTRKGIWIGWNQKVWQDSIWTNLRRQQYQSTPSGRLDLMQVWDSTGGSWENKFRVLAQYDANQNLVREMGVQQWNSGMGQWVNQANTRDCTHSWSTATATGLKPLLPQLSCQLANPYRAYEPIYCENMQAGKAYQLDVTDMQGRQVLQKTIPGGQTFVLDRSLPTGIYQFRIREGRELRYSRKLLIQR